MGIICSNIFTVSAQIHWCCDPRILVKLMTKPNCDDKAFKFLSPVRQKNKTKKHIVSFLFLLLLNKLHSTSGIMCCFVLKEDIRSFSSNFPLDCEGKHDYRSRKVKLICANTNISMKICIDHSTHNTCIDLTQNIRLYH